MQIRAPGFKADPKSGLALAADQNATQDFALQKSFVRWGDLSYYQGQKLLPDIRGKDTFFQHCIACHGFQSRMANITRDEDGWRSRVAYMRDAMGFFIAEERRGFTDAKAEDVVYFLNQAFGEDSGAAEIAGRSAGLPGDRAQVQRRGAQDRLRRI